MKNTILPLGLSEVLEQILNEGIKPEMKGSVNKFLFPIIQAILLIVFVIEAVNTYKDYKKNGELDKEKLIVTGVCLALCITAPVFMWGIIGW